MHLNDEQIAAIERIDINNRLNFNPELPQHSTAIAHIKQCDMCTQKLLNLKEFRNKLANDTNSELPSFQWQAIEREIRATNKSAVVTGLNRKIKRLQIAFVALAASLTVLLVYPQFANNSINAAQRQLTSIVEENHLLQNEFNNVMGQEFLQTVSYRSKESQLRKIDYKIQQSYIDNFPIEQKISLWNERKQLLTQLLKKDNQSTIVYI